MNRGAASTLLPVLALTACTSYETVRGEFDAISRTENLDAQPQQSQYLDNPIPLFDTAGAAEDEDNPDHLARDLMEELTDKAWGDLQYSTEVIRRLLWVAELDRSPLNRIVALQGIASLMDGLGLGITVENLSNPPSAEEAGQWLSTLSALLLAARNGELDDAGRQQLVDLLDLCARVPLRTPLQRRRLIEELAPDRRRGLDGQLENAMSTTLDRALEHAVFTMFLIQLLDNLPSGVPVRRAALLEIHRRGGADSVALLLDVTRRSRDSVPSGDPGFDPSPFVLLELVRLCGQLNAEQALRGHGTGPAPAEFLYAVIRAYDVIRTPSNRRGPRGLYLMALEALALSLGRPVSFDQQWADDWFRDWNEERIRGGPDR